MKQRQFPMLATMPSPRDVPQKVVALCESEAQAIATSLMVCRANRKQASVAKVLGISTAYLSMLKKGERNLPDDGGRMAAAICVATGCNLLKQYLKLQEALRESSATEADRCFVTKLATMAHAHWQREQGASPQPLFAERRRA